MVEVSMEIKEGVELTNALAIFIALLKVEPVLKEHEQDLVITSMLDGKHMKNSKHYEGAAVDLRTWDLVQPETCVQRMQDALGRDYDVVLERDHIHLEYDRKD